MQCFSKFACFFFSKFIMAAKEQARIQLAITAAADVEETSIVPSTGSQSGRKKAKNRSEARLAEQAKNARMLEVALLGTKKASVFADEAKGAAESANQSNVDMQRTLENEKRTKVATIKNKIDFLQSELAILEGQPATGTELALI
mmetsp:Transcript_71836/g.144579  ORF Transcript_71836/g.144579 Transcript_71836/m.144579 type:complete len:145 (+) Transcript_71836:88-522(+)